MITRYDPQAMAILMTLAALLIGCESPSHQKRIVEREQKFNQTIAVLQHQEAHRTDKVGQALNEVAQQHERDVRDSRRIPPAIERAVRDEFERWEERAPLYKRFIEKELEGDPDNIERTLPFMLY